ncbi:hypothetical protein HU147_12475 [Planomicrobium chinense]|uniref:sugar-transfer associated ATP-grasp domain-containing protein n=1 Tax=Planococcus chinensis TaxID=272917 RepID=UPI001CC63801|nr:sugar-transfer associated ATP-grasp domain-containing protein [Planococcus chinensis]MBZ5202035.1 hypothetical protein [Planococcus chinensis]
MNKKFLTNNISRFNDRVRTYGSSKYIYCWSSFIYNAVRFGSSPDDYFRYEFYKKNNAERKTFITYRRSKRLIKELNKAEGIEQVLDKVAFNSFFSAYVQREWLDTRNCTFKDFENFIKNHISVIVKPISAGSGKGIWKYTYKQEDDLRQVFLKVKKSLVEELIEQHDHLVALNPSSVNTIRVFTVKKDNKINVIACSLRTGAGESIIDNLHAGGMSVSIDIEKGVVFTPAINAKLEKFQTHPSTGIEFMGFEVPHWKQVIEVVKKAASDVPSLRYLGWDVAVTKDGVELIEANHDPAHDLIQISDQIGKYELVKQYI